MSEPRATDTSASASRGPASLVLIHGFLGSPTSWDELVESWAPEARILRLEVLGHGASMRAAEGDVSSFDDEIRRLLGQLRAAELPSPCWLIGYSLGARLALGLAASAGESFERVVLISGRDGLTDPDEARARAALDDALARTLVEQGLPSFVDRWEALPLFATQAALPPGRRAAHRARRLEHDPAGLARALATLSLGRMPSYGHRAASRVRRATLVVGEHDAKFRALASALADVLGAEILTVPSAGHDVVLEQPRLLASILRGAEP